MKIVKVERIRARDLGRVESPSFFREQQEKMRQRFGECRRCGEPLDHRCQYATCEPCLRVVGVPGYPR